jgi:hypothetical protein
MPELPFGTRQKEISHNNMRSFVCRVPVRFECNLKQVNPFNDRLQPDLR